MLGKHTDVKHHLEFRWEGEESPQHGAYEHQLKDNNEKIHCDTGLNTQDDQQSNLQHHFEL